MSSKADRPDGDAPRAPFNPYAPPESLSAPPVRPKPADPGPPAEPERPLAVSVNVSDDDVADFLAYHHGRRSRLGPVVRMSLPMLAVVLIVDLTLWRTGRFTILTVVLSAFWLAIAIALFPWLWRRQLRQLARRGGPRHEHSIEIGPGGLVGLAQGKPAVRRSWSVVSQIATTDKHLFFYVSDPDAEIVSVEIVPRREFATPEAADAFLAAACHWKQAAPITPPAEGPQSTGIGTRPTEDRLTVAFEPTIEDRRYAARARRRVLRREYRLMAFWTLLSLFWTILLGYRLYQASDHPLGLFRDDTLADLALFGFMLLITLSGIGATIKHLLRRRVPLSRGPITISISPEGYTLLEADGSPRLSQSWAAVPGVGSDDRYLILAYQILDPRRGLTLNHFIPRRAFPASEAADAFLAAARCWHASAHGLPDPTTSPSTPAPNRPA